MFQQICKLQNIEIKILHETREKSFEFILLYGNSLKNQIKAVVYKKTAFGLLFYQSTHTVSVCFAILMDG